MPSSKLTQKRYLLAQEVEQWKSVFPDHFTEDAKATYKKREDAVRMYAQQISLKQIELKTGICRQELYRFVDRCMTLTRLGKPIGFIALVEYKHIIVNKKANAGKLVGSKALPGNLQALFAKYPSIEQVLFDYAVLGKIEGLTTKEINPPISAVQKEFERLCERAGIQSPHYPFNCESAGQWSIRRWVNKQREIHAVSYQQLSDPDAAVSLAASGSASRSSTPVTRYYQRVQCDGHRIDYRCKIEIPSDDGEGVVYKQIERIWIILLIEVKSSAVIGYTYSFEENYNADDIMRAVRNTMRPWQRRNLTIKTVGYEEGEGLPSGVIEQLAYARFDELYLDNAKAHLASLFMDYVERVAGAVPVFIPTAAPNVNGVVEGFFKILEEAGLHRMPGTTGSNINDPRGRQQNVDMSHILTVGQLMDLIDLLISKLNAHRQNKSSLSPLEMLQRAVTRRSCIIRHIPVAARSDLLRYDTYAVKHIGKDHNRICVRFLEDVYQNDLLKTARLLVGRTVLVLANSEDARTIECVLDDGTHLGTLLCSPKWRATPHSIQTKKEINKRKGLKLPGKDLALEYRRHLEVEAKKSKREATKLARLRQEQDFTVCENPDLTELELHDAEISETSELQTSNAGDDYEVDAALEEAEKLLANIRTVYR